jgi:hypothetical protein
MECLGTFSRISFRLACRCITLPSPAAMDTQVATIKDCDAPGSTQSMRSALSGQTLERLSVVYSGRDCYWLEFGIAVCRQRIIFHPSKGRHSP